MQQDREKWNARFSQRSPVSPSPSASIVEHVDRLVTGTVLDVASGDGAAALYLASKGFDVSALDISDVALNRLQRFAEEQDLIIDTHAIDLDQSTSLSNIGFFDNIVITHFKPSRSHWEILLPCLKTGGMLLISTFNLKQHQENNFSRRFCLEEGELINLSTELKLVHHESAIRKNNHLDDYIFQKINREEGNR